MAQIYNSQLSKEIQKGAKLQVSRDIIPSQLAEKVVPVMEVNPALLRRCDIVAQTDAVNTTSATVYTCPTDQDFYLVAASLATIKDATSTSTLETLRVTINGAVKVILRIPSFTLTAQSAQETISFPFPIKCDRGSTITVNNGTNVANITSSATIIGYVDEQSNA